MPWTHSDMLVKSDTELRGDFLKYDITFELVVLLWDCVMYHTNDLVVSPAKLAKYTKAFANCGV